MDCILGAGHHLKVHSPGYGSLGREENGGGKIRDGRKKRERVQREWLGTGYVGHPPKARFEESKSPESLGVDRS